MGNDIKKNEIKKYEPLWGEWIIDNTIGEGSYGTVYEIHNKKNNQKAAVKFISVPRSRAELKDIEVESEEYSSTINDIIDSRKEKYVKEANLLKELKDSKHIVKYQSHIVEAKKVSGKKFGKKNNELNSYGWNIFIRMELLFSLDKYIKKNGLCLGDVINLGIDICSALEDCQEKGIIHRDVKKANIFVSDKGYKLGDFGISKVQFVSKTASKEAGTYDYMAPEIRNHQKFGFNSDIYSLGILMYRLLNNDKFPFVPTDGTDNIDAHMQAQQKRESGVPFPPPLNSEKADDKGKLTEIVLKACEFDRYKRYQSASEMKSDLITLNKIAKNKDVRIINPKETIEAVTSTIKEIKSIPPQSTETIDEFPPSGTIPEISHDAKANPAKKKSNKTKGIIAVAALVIVAAIAIGWNIFAPVPVEDITGIPANKDNTSLIVGETLDIDPILEPDKAVGVIEYISSDENVAVIDEYGVINALAEGETVITVKCDEVVKSFNLFVSAAVIQVEDIEGVMESHNLDVKKNYNIACKVIPENATDKTITYSSSDESVATVDKNGSIKAIKAGKAVITVKSGKVVKTMNLTVKEKATTINTNTGNNSAKKPINNKPTNGTSGGGSSGGSSGTSGGGSSGENSGTSGGGSSGGSSGTSGGSSGGGNSGTSGGGSSGGSSGTSGGGSPTSSPVEGDLSGAAWKN